MNVDREKSQDRYGKKRTCVIDVDLRAAQLGCASGRWWKFSVGFSLVGALRTTSGRSALTGSDQEVRWRRGRRSQCPGHRIPDSGRWFRFSPRGTAAPSSKGARIRSRASSTLEPSDSRIGRVSSLRSRRSPVMRSPRPILARRVYASVSRALNQRRCPTRRPSLFGHALRLAFP